MKKLAAILTLLSLLMSAAEAAKKTRAPDEEDPQTTRAKIHLEAGVAYFNDGKYADAEREMSQAFALRPVPELKYNLAQCQERIGAPDRAVQSYRAYLEARPGSADRSEIEKTIARLEEQIRLQSKEPVPAADGAAPEPAPTVVLAPPPPEKVVFKEIVVFRQPPPKAGRTARIFGLALIGLTAVGLAAGAAFSYTASEIGKDIDSASAMFQTSLGANPADCRNEGFVDGIVASKVSVLGPASGPLIRDAANNLCGFYRVSREAQAINQGAAVIGYGIAGLGAIGVLTAFLYARHQDKRQARDLLAKEKKLPNLTLLPVAGAGGGGLVLSGSF